MNSLLPEALERYCADHSSASSALANELEQYTHKHCPRPEMLSGPWEGAFLRVLVAAIGAHRILEIGMYTGYSALQMAEAMPADGELISCDINADTAAVAQRFFDRSPHGHKIKVRLGPALATIKTLAPSFDLVFIDADKEGYSAYFDASLPLLRSGGLIVADNVLRAGRVLNPANPADHGIIAFNEKVKNDARVEFVMLPIRDGVSVIRKR